MHWRRVPALQSALSVMVFDGSDMASRLILFLTRASAAMLAVSGAQADQTAHCSGASIPGSSVSMATARCLLALDRPGHAMIVLQRLVAADPGDTQAARMLDELLAGAVPVHRYQAQGVRKDSSMEFSGWLAAEVGHDSNINRATSDQVIAVPLLNYRSLTLPELLVQRGSGFAGFSGGATLHMDLGSQTNASLFAQAGLRGNFSELSYLPHNYQFAASLNRRIGEAFDVGLGMSSTQQWLAKYRVLDRAGIRAQFAGRAGEFSFGVAAESAVSVYPQFESLKTREKSTDVRISYRPLDLQASYFFGEEEAPGPIKDLDRGFDGWRLGWRPAWGERVRFDIRATTGRSRYRQFSRLFATRRDDRSGELSLAAEIVLADKWSVTPKVVLEKSDSSLSLNQYRRTQFLAELRRDF